jgi:vacuolar protein sorting-associated protein 13D
VQRVFPKVKPTRTAVEANKAASKFSDSAATLGGEVVVTPLRTEITFDFHRLNILILRAIMRDSYLVGRKVGTFTMSEAKIHATLGSSINVEGSLGGLQVLDLTPDGVNHQRILSVGKDPLTDPPTGLAEPAEDLLTTLTNKIYGTNNGEGKRGAKEERQALSFNITRDLNATVTIKIRMASVWYTHCARFMQELSWCASEFKHYLKTLARSIRDKATDMALGLVQPLANTPKPVDPLETPKHKAYTRQRTESMSKARAYVAARSHNVTISLDIILDTPVLVLPRSSASPQVFVAHLGKMTLKNNNNDQTTPTDTTAAETLHDSERDETDFRFVNQMDDTDSLFMLDDSFGEASTMTPTKESLTPDPAPQQPQNLDLYVIHIRNINLFSLDTSSRKGFRLSALPRAEEFYSCQEDAIPVIHDTAIKLEIERHLSAQEAHNIKEQINVNGSVVKPLRLSLTRHQYEQLLDTIDNIFKIPVDLMRPPTVPTEGPRAETPGEEEAPASALNFQMDPKVKRRLFSQESLAESNSFVAMKSE